MAAVDVNATVVVNMLTLEVVVQNIETAGESAGQTTAHETLLARAGWKRNCCYGGAVQLGEFRAVSGYINGQREGYKAVTAPGYDGPYRAYGQFATNEHTEDLDAFRKFTKDKSNREKADIPEEARTKAVELATELAADGQKSFMKAEFSMDPVLQADSLEYLSSFVGGVEDLSDSKEMLERELMIREEYNGKDHFAVACVLNNLGRIFAYLGDPARQKELLKRALHIMERHFGEDHYLVAEELANLGSAYRNLGDYAAAKDVLERALNIQVKHFGQDHFHVAVTLTGLGDFYRNLGDYAAAKDLLERALNIQVKHFGPDHFDVAVTLTGQGVVHRNLGDSVKAKDVLERAMEIKVKHFGEDHFQVAITLFNLAMAYGDLGDHQKKVEVLKRVLPIFQGHFGAYHRYCVRVRCELFVANLLKRCLCRRRKCD